MIVKKVKPAYTKEDGIGDNMWRTNCHTPAIWGIFVDGIEKARVMRSGSTWSGIDPITFKNLINRTFDYKKEAIEAAKKWINHSSK